MVVSMSAPSTAPSKFRINVDVSALITEDDKPVDSIYSEKQMRLLTETLHVAWAGPPPDEDGEPRPFVAAANVGVFNFINEPAIVPDVFVSLDVTLPNELWAKEHRSYFLWEFGKAPDVVIEVVSNREGGELDEKKKRYRQMRVPYYVVWDPGACLGEKALHVFELRGHLYTKMERAFFDALGLGLVEWVGPYEDVKERWLRWCDAKGELLPTGAEHARRVGQRADEERQRADEASQRADEARQRAENERTRAERLAAKLRALGIDPEQD